MVKNIIKFVLGIAIGILIYLMFTGTCKANDLCFTPQGTNVKICNNSEVTYKPETNRIIVSKQEKKLYVITENNELLLQYPVRIGKNEGCKAREYDKKTPCGEYRITNIRKHTKYKIFMDINYPNKEDIKAGKTGNLIGIHQWYHKDPKAYSQGCISLLKDGEIEAIAERVIIGTKVIIFE